MNRPASLLLLAAFVVVACGGGSTPNGASTPAPTSSGQTGAGGPSTTYDVTYTDGTSVIDSSAYEEALLAAPAPTDGDSSTSGAYHFKTAGWVTALKPGEVVIFANHSLVKVDSVDVAGGETTVQTEAATLDQAIKSGKVGWDYGVNWQDLPDSTYQGLAGALMAMAEPNGAVADVPIGPRPVAASGAGLNWRGTIDGWDTKLGLTPTPDKLNISASAKKTSSGGSSILVSTTGWISNFTQETFLTYDQSQAGEASTKTIGLHGQMQVEWHAAAAAGLGDSLGDVSQFKIPVALPIPFTVGPIPVVLKLMATLQVVPELSSDQASSGGNYTINFASDQGFSIAGGSVTPSSNVGSVDFAVTGDTVSAGWGPVGFALGVEFPRFEISVLNTVSAFISLKSYSTSEWTPGTTLTSDIPPCQKGTSSLAAYAGWNVKALGFRVAGDTTELWKRDFEKYKDDKPCTLTGK